MIATLPTPYPDELLYSLCARYCDRMHYPSKRSAIQELFGTGNVIASVGLPSHIDDFVAALPQGHRFTTPCYRFTDRSSRRRDFIVFGRICVEETDRPFTCA